MSGFGAPARTDTPIPDFATGVPGPTLPSLLSSAMPFEAISTRSTVSPPLRRRIISAVGTHSVTTLFSLARSNAGISST